MTNVKTFGLAAMAVALFAVPMAFASAATIDNVVFPNDDVTISGTGNSTTDATVRITVPTNQVVEIVRTQVTSPTVHAVICTPVGGALGLQEGVHDVTVPVKLPPNTNTYDLTVQTVGVYGGIHAVCTDPTNGSRTFNNALRVTAGDSDGSGSSSSVGSAQWMSDLIAALKAALMPATTPAPTGACATLSAKLVGTQDNVYNQANIQLQGFLLSEGASIPALTAGASFGYKGPQTNAALSLYKASKQCAF